MRLSRTVIFLAILPFSIAGACTQSNAIDWPSSGGGSSGGSKCTNKCGNDVACNKICLDLAAQGECNAVGNCEANDPNDPSDLIKKLKGRDTLTCDSNEKCYRYTDGSLLCLDTSTGDYTDETGGHGNGYSGVYTAADGQVTTDLEVAGSTSTRVTGSTAVSSTPLPASTTGATTGKSGSVTSTSVTPASVTSPSTTSTTGKSGAEKFHVGAAGALGALGLIVGIAL